MGVYLHHGKWYIDYYYQGRRIRECSGTSKTLAKKALEARKGEIVQERFSLHNQNHGLKFEEFAEEYLRYSESYKSSYDRDVIHVNHLLKHFKGCELQTIGPMFIEKYKQKRIKKVRPATVNRELSALRHMFNMAVKWDKVDKNPIDKVAFYKEELLPLRFLSEEEMDLLVNECSSWLKPIVITALNTGMRMREILDLEWRNVDIDLKAITVERSKSKEFRLIPMNEDLYGIFCGISRKYRYVFPNEEGKPFVNIHKGFYAAVRRAGIAHTRFHDLRHTFASHLVMQGTDLVTVKELLGHKDISTTMRYAHLSAEHKRQAVEKLPRISQKDGHHMDTKLRLVVGQRT